MNLRLIFYLLAFLFLASGYIFWLSGGMHMGWTKTSITEMRVDPITEIEFPVTSDAFIPGVEFPAMGAILAALFFLLGFLFRNKPQKTP